MSKGKSLIVLILLISAVMAPLCANDIFSIGFGVSLSYSQDPTEVEPLKFNADNIAIGLEGRLNISYFQLDAVGEISVLDSDTLKLAGILSAGGMVELFDVVKLGVTVGPRMAYLYSNSAKTKTDDEISNGKSLLEAIKDGPINVRFMLDVLAGPVMSIGFAYTVPTQFTISQGNWDAFVLMHEKGQVSLSIQMKLI